MATPPVVLPPSLLDLLSNSIIFDSTLPYLSLSTIFALSRTCQSFRDLLIPNPRAFRYVDLSKCRGAYISPALLTKIDSGGHSWRAERMDENLTEDEFYAGPLRGVLAKLKRLNVLHNVRTLVLDGLASVTNDLIGDIVLRPEYDVKLLSIRNCLNVNETKLQQLLRHLCRPSRPEGTPRLQGLYVFANPDILFLNQHAFDYNSVPSGLASAFDRLGAQYTVDGTLNSHRMDPWYAPSGRILTEEHKRRNGWDATLLACQGIISFNAVLCTHMHTEMAPVLSAATRDYLATGKAGGPPIATIALGPSGCADCGHNPHGAPVWGESDVHEFPLLWPPPWSGRLADAVRPPLRLGDKGTVLPQRLIVSCQWCLTLRHCDQCQKWWCAECYNPGRSSNGATGAANSDNSKVFKSTCHQNCLSYERVSAP